MDDLSQAGLLEPDEIARFVRRGHFVYESGTHGDTWLALELLVSKPRRLQRAAARLADRLRRYRADFVCGPLVGGAFVAQAVAYELEAEFVYAEAQPAAAGGRTRYAIPDALRAGRAGRRAVIVDDVINAGSAGGACVEEIASAGAKVEALASLIVRESAEPELQRMLGLPIEALLTVPWSTWPASDCPLCLARMPLG
jgi:orotate phosphoribosyltransferase